MIKLGAQTEIVLQQALCAISTREQAAIAAINARLNGPAPKPTVA